METYEEERETLGCPGMTSSCLVTVTIGHINTCCYFDMVATGQGKVREIQGQGKNRECCAGSGKFEILRSQEIQENPLKFREI